jgi:hypothetical protein
MNFEYLYIKESAELTTTGYFQAKLLEMIREVLYVPMIKIISDFKVAEWFRKSGVANKVSEHIKKLPQDERETANLILDEIRNKILSNKNKLDKDIAKTINDIELLIKNTINKL